ncbi:MAG: TlpA family protein disulfide reductase [Prolixibacteraceae bacterium]|nr:TlpA family protein disulfide reductase [Prolixibacteraceae bacterium]
MKLLSIFLLLIFVFYFKSCLSSEIDHLSKTNKKLQDLISIQYQTDFKNFNPFSGELGICDTAIVIFHFNVSDNCISSKFLFSNQKGNIGFDGFNSFYTIESRKQLIYNKVKTKDDLFGTQFLMFSFQQLRNLLPQILSDTAVQVNRLSDTLINGIDCYKYEIIMHDKAINMNGELVKRVDSNQFYELLVGKKDYLPRLFISYFNRNSPIWIVSYNKFNLSPTIENSLFSVPSQHSDYVKYSFDEYLIVSKNENILKGRSYLGVNASDWTLPSMAGDPVTFSKIDATLIMLEFWFPYCTGCLAVIPEINEIHKKFQNKGLKVFGVEFTKPDSTKLTDYISKMSIEYPTLFAGKEVAIQYGVSSAPSVFLIKDGKFVYARTGFLYDEIIEVIKIYIE